jgi:hypothetical protein
MKRRREINMENEDVKNTRTYTSYTKNIGKYERKKTTLSKETKTEQKNKHTYTKTDTPHKYAHNGNKRNKLN